MLIATLVALLFLGSGANMMLDGIDQIKDDIKSRIVDENTRNDAFEVVKKLEDIAKDYAKSDSDDEKELLKLIQDYETTTTELKNNMDASYRSRLDYQKKMLAQRFELKDTLSREQWAKVFVEGRAEK
jgi:hypothetical protein